MAMSDKFTSWSTEDERKAAADFFTYIVDGSITKEELIKRYSETSENYEAMYETIVFNGAKETAITLSNLFPNNRENVYILDVVAGTGLCGVEYHKHGFRKMDALDGAEGMLEEAKKKGVYTNFFTEILGDGKLDIEDDTYDVVAVCNFCIEVMRRLPMNAWEELVRVVKPGGYFVNTNYKTTFEENHKPTEEFRRHLRKLESLDQWKLVEVRNFPAYQYGRDGGVAVYKVSSTK